MTAISDLMQKVDDEAKRRNGEVVTVVVRVRDANNQIRTQVENAVKRAGLWARVNPQELDDLVVQMTEIIGGRADPEMEAAVGKQRERVWGLFDEYLQIYLTEALLQEREHGT